MAPRRGRRAPTAAVSGGLRVVWRALRGEIRNPPWALQEMSLPARGNLFPLTKEINQRDYRGRFETSPWPLHKNCAPPGEFYFPLKKGKRSPSQGDWAIFASLLKKGPQGTPCNPQIFTTLPARLRAGWPPTGTYRWPRCHTGRRGPRPRPQTIPRTSRSPVPG